MRLKQTLTMAGAAARGLGELGRDGLGDLTGRSLPYRPERVATPAGLSRLLERGALCPLPAPPRITAVEPLPIPSVSSNCQNLVLRLTQAGAPVLPDTLFVKLPIPSIGTRWFFSVIRSWELESYFFRHVATSLPLQTPRVYATASLRSRFFLVQENLHENPAVKLFTNPDMALGPSLATARRCLDTFARLHAVHIGLDAPAREAVLPLTLHPFLSPALSGVSRSLNRLALAPCMRKRPGAIPPHIERAYRDSIAHWDRLLAHWFDGPLSLLHGDSHLGNFYICGEAMGMLDWQAVHWGKGIRDVQYFLINSLPAATLALHERELVDYYVQRRADYGAPVDRDTTWQEYRSFTFHTLFTIVVAIGFGALNEEQDALMTEVLRRAVAAVERVDYPGWLRDYLDGE